MTHVCISKYILKLYSENMSSQSLYIVNILYQWVCMWEYIYAKLKTIDCKWCSIMVFIIHFMCIKWYYITWLVKWDANLSHYTFTWNWCRSYSVIHNYCPPLVSVCTHHCLHIYLAFINCNNNVKNIISS